MTSFGCAKFCFSVLCCLSTVLIWSPSKTLFRGSEIPLMYGRQTVAFGFSVFVVRGGWVMLALWWMNLFGYPFFNKAFTTRSFSSSSAPNVDEKVLALCRSVWTTAALWAPPFPAFFFFQPFPHHFCVMFLSSSLPLDFYCFMHWWWYCIVTETSVLHQIFWLVKLNYCCYVST